MSLCTVVLRSQCLSSREGWELAKLSSYPVVLGCSEGTDVGEGIIGVNESNYWDSQGFHMGSDRNRDNLLRRKELPRIEVG